MPSRIRSIKPELPQSESMGRVSREARLLFMLLFTVADDEGKLRGSPLLIASLLYPYDKDAPELIEGWLGELDREDCIRIYSIKGATYILIVNWSKHQRIEHPSRSRLPELHENSRVFMTPREDSGGSHEDSGGFPLGSGPGPGPGPWKGRDLHLASLGAATTSKEVLKDAVQKHNSGIVREEAQINGELVDADFFPEVPSSEIRLAGLAKERAGASIPTWTAYADAYVARYSVMPVRNRSVNAQLAQLVQRLGIEAAPAVAAFYVHHNFMLYVRAKHPVNLLLRDAEGLHTEWRSGRTVTGTEAMQTDKTAGIGQVWKDLIEEVSQRETIAAKGADDETY